MMTRRELLVVFAAASVFRFREENPMEQRISLVTLGVNDLATSKRFYIDGLGWKPAFQNKEIVFFQAGGMVFALFLRDKLAEDLQADQATFGRAGMALAYNVRSKNEVDPLLKQAEAAGATILKRARAASWAGYSASFAAPPPFPWQPPQHPPSP